MPKNPSADQQEVHFFFSKSKATNEEAGKCFITLFARLSMEIPASGKQRGASENKTIWVDIEEVASEQATSKMKKMPDSIERYEISKELFWELHKISQRCPEELYYITPLSYLHDYRNR